MHLVALLLFFLIPTVVIPSHNIGGGNATTADPPPSVNGTNCIQNTSKAVDSRTVVIIVSSVVSVATSLICLSICGHYLLYIRKHRRHSEEGDNDDIELHDNSIYHDTGLSMKLRRASLTREVNLCQTMDDIAYLALPLPEEHDSQEIGENVTGEDKAPATEAQVECPEGEEVKVAGGEKDGDLQECEIVVDNEIYGC